jgi:hypothetical protein
MAKTKVKIKGLDDAIEEVFKDYKKAIKVAAQEATEKAKEDLYANAVSCLVRYYEDYDPTSYNRTYNLIESFVPYANPVKESTEGFVCTAGVLFDANRIADTYSGSEIYTPTDADWIISNFLNGIHPRTDGSTAVGGGNYEYEKYQGSFVPAIEMQSFIDKYYDTFDRTYRRALGKQVLETMRK